jgi:hypothetical protein
MPRNPAQHRHQGIDPTPLQGRHNVFAETTRATQLTGYELNGLIDQHLSGSLAEAPSSHDARYLPDLEALLLHVRVQIQ